MNDLLWRSASELAGLVRSGELGARELVEACLRRIDELEPHINAFTHVAHESALAAADQVAAGDPRPFAGVPIAVKDNRAVAGMPLTMGSDLFGELVVPHDSFLVRRLREAGFVIVGKTALPEMGILPSTESRRNGPTRNPWNLERTPGGSSGGAAAAVAAGMVPIAHGNDGGGSIRIPAACCGLVGLKPARGRVSVGPELGDSFLVSDGMLTRSVADTAAVLDVLAGYEPGDATWAPPPPAPFSELSAREPGRLRIGMAFNLPLEGAALDPACEQAVRDTAGLLESLGHEVQECEPPWSGLDLLPDFTRAFGPQISLATLIGSQLAGREPTEADVEPLTWMMWTDWARGTDSLTAASSMMRLQSVARAVVEALSPYDAVLTPTLAEPPVAIGVLNGVSDDPWATYERSGHFTPYTAVLNVTGQPAISLPLHESPDGLPLGVHLIGPPAREEVLLRLAAQLESALPWVERRPELPA